jgi:hypothetical protein
MIQLIHKIIIKIPSIYIYHQSIISMDFMDQFIQDGPRNHQAEARLPTVAARHGIHASSQHGRGGRVQRGRHGRWEFGHRDFDPKMPGFGELLMGFGWLFMGFGWVFLAGFCENLLFCWAQLQVVGAYA